ncbi:MAG: hypothetical protein JSR39_11060 [Verrucomicrobia bacterium]|nr:hypothetical protein [Verrucomicrobiota bacterium]
MGIDPNNSQQFESYVPVYDAVPETWEEGREFLVEQLKKISNAVNVREIGWFLDEELLSGKQLFPGTSSANDQQFRSILRMVVNTGPLIAGLNPGINHNILFDVNFTLISLWVCGTNSATFKALTITGNDVVMNATQLVITSPMAFNRSIAVIEYTQEQ